MDNDNIEYRVELLEGKTLELCADVKQILQNHLPHIQVEIARVTTTVKVVGGLIIAGVTALIIMGLTP